MTCLLVIIALGFILLGVFLSEPRDFWNKGIRICLSCIGIG